MVLLIVGIILLAAVNSAADSLAEVCLARGGRVLGYNVRVAMYSHLQRLSLAYHDKRRTGDVLTRVTGDVLVVEDFVVEVAEQPARQLPGPRRHRRRAAVARVDRRAHRGRRHPGAGAGLGLLLAADQGPSRRRSAPARASWRPRPRRC